MWASRADPRTGSWAASGPDAHTGNAHGVSPHDTRGSSSKGVSGPAGPASPSGAATGASAARCSSTPPHCWHAQPDATPTPPLDTSRASSHPSGGRSPVASETPHGPRPRSSLRSSLAVAADAATTAAPTHHARVPQARPPATDGAAYPGRLTTPPPEGSPTSAVISREEAKLACFSITAFRSWHYKRVRRTTAGRRTRRVHWRCLSGRDVTGPRSVAFSRRKRRGRSWTGCTVSCRRLHPRTSGVGNGCGSGGCVGSGRAPPPRGCLPARALWRLWCPRWSARSGTRTGKPRLARWRGCGIRRSGPAVRCSAGTACCRGPRRATGR